MVETVIAARALNRLDIARLTHHANASGIAHRVLADGALVGRGVVKATAAKVDLLLNLQDGLGQAAGLLGIGLEQVVGDALGDLGQCPADDPAHRAVFADCDSHSYICVS